MDDGRVLILEEVTSTQDAALLNNLQPGDVCIAYHQTAGRGRWGNVWNSKGGVAVTVVLENATSHLPIAVAATLAARLNNLVPNYQIGIKWPNDLLVDGKKLAGILIEQFENRWLVGVGVNVLASPLPTSVGLNQLGSGVALDRVAELVAASVLDAVQLDESAAVTEWRKRDILIGTTQIVQSGNNTVQGIVLSIDPCNNLLLQNDQGIFQLPAASSKILTPCK